MLILGDMHIQVLLSSRKELKLSWGVMFPRSYLLYGTFVPVSVGV